MSENFRDKIKKKIINPVLSFLKQGMTPKKLALSLTLGFFLGLFPVIGVTTLLCMAVAFLFKLNMAAIQLANYIVYPLQIIFIIPLMKIGSLIVNINPIPYTIDELLEMMGSNFYGTLEIIWIATLMGVLAWAVLLTPITLLLYFILKSAFIRLAKE